MKPHLRLPPWADTLIFLATIAALFGALVLLASCGPEEPAFQFGEEEATLVDKSGGGHVRRPGELAAPPDVVLPGIVDLFAGGGGASTGIEAATGRAVDIAINHSATALAVHAANHPRTKHLTADIWEVAEGRHRRPAGRPALGVPDCTHFSVAKGGKPRKQNIRSLAWVVVRWAREVRPAVIFLENVAEFQGWGPLDVMRAARSRRGWARPSASGRGALERSATWSTTACSTRPTTARPRGAAGCSSSPGATGSPSAGRSRRTGPGLPAVPHRGGVHRLEPPVPEHLRPEAAARREDAVAHRAGDPGSCSRTRPHSSWAPRADPDPDRLRRATQGQRPGQPLDLHEPLGTVVAGGVKHALVAPSWRSTTAGTPRRATSLARPFDTITTQDHHALVTVSTAGSGSPGPRVPHRLLRQRERGGQSLTSPCGR
jgi:DNA (cytosine-5)-methyltransferase 1